MLWSNEQASLSASHSHGTLYLEGILYRKETTAAVCVNDVLFDIGRSRYK